MLMRHLNKDFACKLQSSGIISFYNDNRSELFLGIRNNYINLYYRGASICKAYEENGSIICEIAKKYLDLSDTSGYSVVPFDKIRKEYASIKSRILDNYSHNEKVAQQLLILNNNSNDDAEYFCIDMEYIKQRENSTQVFFGRADIVAVSKSKPHKVVMIELKYGKGAIGGNSGIVKHLRDYTDFISNNEFDKYLDEVVEIINSYELIGCPTPLGYVERKDFSDKPDIKFIIVKADASVKATMRRYLFHDEKGCSTKNYGLSKATGFADSIINPEFLFSLDNGENIDDIVGSGLYSKGLC